MKKITPNTAKFWLVNVYITSCKFTLKIPSIEDTKSKDPEVSIEIEPKGLLNKEKANFRLELSISLKSKNNRFNGSFTTVGLFEFSKELDFDSDESLNNYFYLNSSAILFPYVRAFIANMTAQSGFETLHIPTLNLTPLKDRLIQNTIIQ